MDFGEMFLNVLFTEYFRKYVFKIRIKILLTVKLR